MDHPILSNFLSLCAIPHKSHHEEAISAFLYDWGVKKGLAAIRDEAGNVILDKPGTPGHENAPVAILQAHMDMVCVAEDGRAYDPLTDPIRVINDGETLTADGTSLGGDDGAGVAMAMAILEDDSAVHGPIRAIFTVDEEDGMSGANALHPRHLEGKYVINLDWEAFGSLCCSSAGSDMYAVRRNAEWETPAADAVAYALSVQGLEGGHSGSQIHLGRANAIRMAAAVLAAGAENSAALSSFRGGSAHNAIPAAAYASIVLPAEKAPAFLEAARREIDARLEACGLTDPGAVITIAETGRPEKVLSPGMSRDILSLLSAVQDGVNTMSGSIPGLVESSANTGLAELRADGFAFVVHQRSSEPGIMDAMGDRLRKQAGEYGFEIAQLSSSPPWPVRPGSHLVEICQRHFRELFGREIRVEPVHAGLECGCFSNKNPALDIISIGPDILDIHSPKETLVLRTVFDCDALVRRMLKEIAEEE